MKPPICEVCGKDFRARYFYIKQGGECLDFSDYEPVPETAVGHPKGSGWFCSEHAEYAEKLRHLTLKEAIKKTRKEFEIVEADIPKKHGLMKDPELWIINAGQNGPRVYSIIRKTITITPKEAKELLSMGSFKLISAWPSDLKTLMDELQEAGAEVEIRYDN